MRIAERPQDTVSGHLRDGVLRISRILPNLVKIMSFEIKTSALLSPFVDRSSSARPSPSPGKTQERPGTGQWWPWLCSRVPSPPASHCLQSQLSVVRCLRWQSIYVLFLNLQYWWLNSDWETFNPSSSIHLTSIYMTSGHRVGNYGQNAWRMEGESAGTGSCFLLQLFLFPTNWQTF